MNTRGEPRNGREGGKRPRPCLRRSWPEVDGLLAVYFTLRMNPGPRSSLGAQAMANAGSGVRRDGSATLELLADLGTILRAIAPGDRAVIEARWGAWYLARTCRSRAQAAAREGRRVLSKGSAEFRRLEAEEAHWWSEADRYRTAHRRLELWKGYQRGMRALSGEILARDLYARMTMGPGAGLTRLGNRAPTVESLAARLLVGLALLGEEEES